MSDKSTIQIRIGAVEVTCEGTVDLEQLEEVLRGLKSQLPELMQPGRSQGPTARELLDRSEARTFGEKAGVVAYWLEHHRGRRDWRSGDIVDVLRDADEPAPANITDALNQKLKKGLFEVHDRRWRLSGEGRGWVRYQLLNEREED
jgi:hypothetical protein